MAMQQGFNVESLKRYIDVGAKDRDWYQRCENLFVELYGRDRLSLVTKLFAATSINSSLKSNVRLFRKALYEIENDLPFSDYLPVMLGQLQRVRQGLPLTGRKISAFAAAMSGDVNAVVVDIWLLRAFGQDRKYYRANDNRVRSGGATDKQFTYIESVVRGLAYVKGLQPRELSAMIWAGTRIVHGGDTETTYENILRFQEYNMYERRNTETRLR